MHHSWEWHERKETLIAGGIIAGYGVAQMPTTTNINSEYESPLELLTGSADVSFSDEILGEEENDTPMKKKLFEYETPSKTNNELLRFQNTQTFLSPTTKELQNSIEKAVSSVKVVYNTDELKAARKNILQLVDHILSHELVWKIPKLLNL